MKNTELKSFLDDLGMTMVSSHCNYKQDFERKAEEAAAIGMNLLPFFSPSKKLECF